MSDSEKLDCLRLIRSENVGPITFHKLLKQFGTAGKALEAIPVMAKRGGRKKPIKLCSVKDAETEFNKCLAKGIALIASCESAYPQSLLNIHDVPPILAVRGNIDILNAESSIAMVGARSSSINGKKMARLMSADFIRRGFIVVSGMARGIDTAVHEGCLYALRQSDGIVNGGEGGEKGSTIAVLAGGVDVVYPPENQKMYDEIVENGGAIVSEMPLGAKPQSRHFPRRNRIISGVSQGVVVVEATAKSGSLITARYALEQGREVFAVPGFPLDPRSFGTNYLIKDGATLVSGADDVVEGLQAMQDMPLFGRLIKPVSGLAEDYSEFENISDDDIENAQSVVESSIGHTPTSIDEIVRECGVCVPVVSSIILDLELAGKIERHQGNKVSLL
ncbi:MAG: DNA-protecting protein DprA [Alphaproteobacteria bacterium]|nr:DNA-protecting protein DprA [Alphaproteobacteria bacterium]